MNDKEQLEKYKNYLLARKQSLNYYNIINIWTSFLNTKKIETFTQETITDFFNEYNNYSKNSRNQFIKAGRHYYTIFLQIPKEQNEWHKIKLLKVESKTPDYLNEKDIENAKKYLITYSKKLSPGKIRALIDFMFYSGCRKNELLILKRNNINLEENTAKLYGKGNKERTVCYPEKVKIEIQQYFLSEIEEINAFNITSKGIECIMKRIGKHLGKRVYAHLIRHSFARNLLYNKGIDLNTVSKLLGHSSIVTTMIYVNPDEKTIRDNYKKLVG